MKSFNTILNGGKMNSGNRLEYTALLLHTNPLLCAAGWIGVLLIYRFTVLKEPFPDFLKPEDFMLRPIFRQVRDYKKAVGYDTQYQSHRKMFDLIGFVSNAVTHLGRGSAQREMFDHGICLEHIGVLARYLNSSQANNYIVNTPSDCMVDHSGGDGTSYIGIGTFCPAWDTVGRVPDEGISEVAPYIEIVSY
jgi:hypothetical protein